MIIIVDTSIFYPDLRLSGSDFRTLLEGIKKTPHGLAVPEIVVLETANKYKEEVCEKHGQATKALEKLSRLVGTPLSIGPRVIDTEALVKDYEPWLREQLKLAKAGIIPFPEAGHPVVVARALARRRPFDVEGRKGYRDALIWESIVDYLRANPGQEIAFITANTRDFADSDGKSLHPHLINDLKAAGIPPTAVALFNSLDALLATHVRPALTKAADIAEKLAAGTYAPLNLNQWLDSKLLGILTAESAIESLGVGSIYSEPEIDVAHNVTVMGKPDVSILTEDEYLIEFEVGCDLEIDVFIDKSDYYSMGDDSEFSILDADHNDHVMSGILMVPVKMGIRLTFNSKSKVVTSIDLASIERDFRHEDKEDDPFPYQSEDGLSAGGEEDARKIDGTDAKF